MALALLHSKLLWHSDMHDGIQKKWTISLWVVARGQNYKNNQCPDATPKVM